MRSRQAEEILRNIMADSGDVSRGLGRIAYRGLASRYADGAIGNIQALPVSDDVGDSQNDLGQFYFTLGYSALDGPDVFR